MRVAGPADRRGSSGLRQYGCHIKLYALFLRVLVKLLTVRAQVEREGFCCTAASVVAGLGPRVMALGEIVGKKILLTR